MKNTFFFKAILFTLLMTTFLYAPLLMGNPIQEKVEQTGGREHPRAASTDARARAASALPRRLRAAATPARPRG